MIDAVDRIWVRFKKEGGTVLHTYWTIGRYDAVITLYAPDERSALKALMRCGDLLSTETMLAIPRAGAVRLVE